MTVFPTPKINLGLNILKKRPDGFHEIETLFLPCIAFRDKLEIEEAGALEIEIPGADWNQQEDLTVKAWKLLNDEFGIPPVRIFLEKGIPTGAGLGGGSADASATLKVLNSLFSLGLDEDGLARRAARLGSDCAFFVYDRPMLGRGRGELLSPFDFDLSGFEIRVVMPEGERVSTREAYAGVVPSEPAVPLVEALLRPVEEWRDCVFNDFEASVFAAHPRIAAAKEEMYRDGAAYAAMSGSGAAVFGFWSRSA